MENMLAEIPGPLKSMGVFTLVLCHIFIVSPPSFFSLLCILWHSSIYAATWEFIKALHVSLHNQNPSLRQTTENYFLFAETKIINVSSQPLLDRHMMSQGKRGFIKL